MTTNPATPASLHLDVILCHAATLDARGAVNIVSGGLDTITVGDRACLAGIVRYPSNLGPGELTIEPDVSRFGSLVAMAARDRPVITQSITEDRLDRIYDTDVAIPFVIELATSGLEPGRYQVGVRATPSTSDPAGTSRLLTVNSR